jgi:hypothetical protein
LGDPRDELLLSQLEPRRAAYDQAMWRAPTLTIAGQSFLLALLANEDLSEGLRQALFWASLLTVLAAVVVLLLNRAREVAYSEAID